MGEVVLRHSLAMPGPPEPTATRDHLPQWRLPALRALGKAVIDALDAGDWDAARNAAQSLARLLDSIVRDD